MGAGCLFLNENGQIMLVKPTYKASWEIPGGIVENNEAPKQCCQREVEEELGVEREIGRLLVVDYNSEEGEKTESLMFIFHGGTLSASEIKSVQLNHEELSEFCFFAPDDLPLEMTPMLRNRVLAASKQVKLGSGVYLENQESRW